MPSYVSQPEFLVDRSLGRYAVPEALRARGLVVRTLAEVFGEAEQMVADRDWLHRAGQAQWVVLTKDERIRRRRFEVEAIIAAKVRVFCLTRGQLRAVQQVAYFVNNMDRILLASRRPGPFIYAVHEHRLQLVWPTPPKGHAARSTN